MIGHNKTTIFVLLALIVLSCLGCTYDKSLKTERAGFYYNRGISYFNEGSYDYAIRDFTRAIKLDPIYADVYNLRGDAYLEIGQYDKAISDFTRAIEIDQNSAMFYVNRGVAYGKKDQYNKALSDFTLAIKIDPKNAVVYRYRGDAYSDKCQYDKAISDYSKAIELNPKDAIAYLGRGYANKKRDRFNEAISDFTKAIEIKPGYCKAYINRGSVYDQTGQYGKAISDFTKAIEVNLPGYAGAYNRLAWLYATTKDASYRNGSRAVELARKALIIERTWVTLDTLAAAFAENRDFSNAVKTEKEAVSLCADPTQKKELEKLIYAYQAKKTYVQYKYGQ